MFDLDELLANVTNEFKVCDKCKGTNLTTLIPALESLDSSANIVVGCQSYCGPGRDYLFVFVNNKPIKAQNQGELLEKVKNALNF